MKNKVSVIENIISVNDDQLFDILRITTIRVDQTPAYKGGVAQYRIVFDCGSINYDGKDEKQFKKDFNKIKDAWLKYHTIKKKAQ